MAAPLNVDQFDADRRPLLAAIVRAQIGTDYQRLAAELSGDFQPTITRVFPDHLLALYLLTDVRRRQVWHAYLAGMSLDEPLFVDQVDHSALRCTLMDQSSESLIAQAYGSTPRGYLSALARLGTHAHPAQTYSDLHLLLGRPGMHMVLNRFDKIGQSTMDIINNLGPDYSRTRLSALIEHPGAACDLRGVLDQFVLVGLIERGQLLERLSRLRGPRDLQKLLKELFEAAPFPAMPIHLGLKWKPLGDRRTLLDTAERFSNCIAQFIPEVLRGECYFYERPGDEPALIQLNLDGSFGWYLAEEKGMENAKLSSEMKMMIREELRQAGIVREQSMEIALGMLCHMRPNMRRRFVPPR